METLAENKETYNALRQQDSGYFECQLPIITETEKAVCFDTYTGHLDHQRPKWVPKSQMQILDMGPDAGTRYFVKNWLCKEL